MNAKPIARAGLVLLLLAFSSPSAAQTQVLTGPPEKLAFDRPESWALVHFTAATLLSGLETPSTRRPGDVSIGLEIGWLPSLSPAELRVGFDGFKTEDLNKAPFIPRPRVTIGLPARWSLIVAGVPPIRMFGVKATLLALGLERPLVETSQWSVGLRGYGQIGTANAAYTCPASKLAFAPGAPGNTDGCEALSSDTATLRYVGAEASVAYQPGGSSRLSPHAAIGLSYVNDAFQVDAPVYGYVDHTRMVTDGTIVSGSGGVTARFTSRLSVGFDVFYSPFRVSRSPGTPAQTDGFFNLRALISYRVR